MATTGATAGRGGSWIATITTGAGRALAITSPAADAQARERVDERGAIREACARARERGRDRGAQGRDVGVGGLAAPCRSVGGVVGLAEPGANAGFVVGLAKPCRSVGGVVGLA